MNAPNSTLSIQQVILKQAGATPDGSGDLTLGTLYADADIPGPSTLTLQAADGVAGGAHSAWSTILALLFFLHVIWLGYFRRSCKSAKQQFQVC